MNYLKIATTFYMQNPILNTVLILGVIGLGWFLWTYRKTQVLMLASTIKAEAVLHLKGREKLEFALKWLMKQNFYKNSILKFIPQKVIEWLINAVFNKNKDVIEAK
ncbi:Uncharacterised protein [Sebaldella termitidis]|uniref:Uncharacterized protein n=1 Tax=Sebaldella termitidis (strain ATCC 33386 / NCTC 11300) TaxID=526218 RepID=D1AN55_SEBTE|nr:hypothetical protein [Sebaldella termitidis]ACZ09659.1 hypothetical protein Sterm_2815 [Sebaldella termitidis ATCC 33386]SUI24991.1 Uncharacterised protein [Sebaldella termitidis]